MLVGGEISWMVGWLTEFARLGEGWFGRDD